MNGYVQEIWLVDSLSAQYAVCLFFLRLGLCLCPCAHSCLFVYLYLTLKPLLHYTVSACVVFCESWVLLCPAGNLIFHHAVCYTTPHCMKVYMCTLSCSLSCSLFIHLPPPSSNSLTATTTYPSPHMHLIKARSSLD